MSTDTILTLSNGRGIDLTNPLASDIEFAVIAEHLAKEKRYNGATPGIEYSVAQHSVIGADVAFNDTKNIELAGYFLLHDGAEAFLKDDTTPKKRALAQVAFANFGVLAESIMASFDMLTDRFDAAIHEAAGLSWPPSPAMKSAIKAYDLIMFVTEWRDLMRSITHPNWDDYRNIAPLPLTLSPWDWRTADKAFRNRCKLYLPSFWKQNGSAVTDDRISARSTQIETSGDAA